MPISTPSQPLRAFNSPIRGSLSLVIIVVFNPGAYRRSEVARMGCSFPIFPAGIVEP